MSRYVTWRSHAIKVFIPKIVSETPTSSAKRPEGASADETMDSTHVDQTPYVRVNSSECRSHDSIDSGYLSSFTPHNSGNNLTVTGCRTRSSTGALSKKHYRIRADPIQCEKAQRRRTRHNHALNTSDLVSEHSIEHDSLLDPSCTNDNQNLMVHSTPSCIVGNEFGEISGIKRKWQTTVPVIPASTDLRLLSPPPSPTVPTSSYAAYEPTIQEDVEMKLVEPTLESKLQPTTPPRLRVSRIVISPVRRRNSPVVTSVENRRLSELCIADLTADIKPKRLDFDRSSFVALWNSGRVALNYMGREKVDFLTLLGEESNHPNVVSKILSYLSPQDLCSATMASTVWKRVCESDFCANRRRMNYILCKQNIKENLKIVAIAKKAKREEDIQMSPKSRQLLRKGCLMDVQNVLRISEQQRPPNSPPVSPSKVKFHCFVKVSRFQ